MMRLRRGRDAHGVIHYDSLIKQRYIYPVCRTPYLDLRDIGRHAVVTCMGCIGDPREFEGYWDEDAC